MNSEHYAQGILRAIQIAEAAGYEVLAEDGRLIVANAHTLVQPVEQDEPWDRIS